MATTIQVRTQGGTGAGTITLDDAWFGIEPNTAVLHQVVTGQLAARRAGTHSTKTRAEVRGGGAKPWRQKGTGRSRQGSIRSPQWTGGGVAHGPKPRSHRQKVNRKMTALALRSALSDRASSERVVVVEGWDFDTPRTRTASECLTALELTGRVLLVLDRRSDMNAALSFRNLPGVQLVERSELNAYDVLCSDWLVFTRQTLPGESEVADAPAAPDQPATGDEPEAAATDQPATDDEADEPEVSPAEEAAVDEADEPEVSPEETAADEADDATADRGTDDAGEDR